LDETLNRGPLSLWGLNTIPIIKRNEYLHQPILLNIDNLCAYKYWIDYCGGLTCSHICSFYDMILMDTSYDAPQRWQQSNLFYYAAVMHNYSLN